MLREVGRIHATWVAIRLKILRLTLRCAQDDAREWCNLVGSMS